MNDIQIFGKLCPTCRRFAQFGEIEIPSDAAPSQLRAKLAEIGWQSDFVTCESQGCDTTIFGERDQMMIKAQF